MLVSVLVYLGLINVYNVYKGLKSKCCLFEYIKFQ